jgi:hypothetical protein
MFMLAIYTPSYPDFLSFINAAQFLIRLIKTESASIQTIPIINHKKEQMTKAVSSMNQAENFRMS